VNGIVVLWLIPAFIAVLVYVINKRQGFPVLGPRRSRPLNEPIPGSVRAVYAESAQRGRENRKAFRKYQREERQKAGGWAGWNYAGYLFAPKGAYLPDEDNVLDWLYKVRALIGAAILVVVGVHYHQLAMSTSGNSLDVLGRIIAIFPAIFGSVTLPLILAVFSVVPATAAVVLFTRPGKRKAAFDQMMRYPAKVMLICLAAYGFVQVFDYIYDFGIVTSLSGSLLS
jgi:hypothetical protein